MSESQEYAITGQVVLDGVAYPVFGPIGYNNLGRFAGKVTEGDYTRDSDDLISAWILTDFSGGQGVFNHRAGSDEGRYWTGTLWTREPFALTLPRKTYLFGKNPAGGATSAIPLGDINGIFYASFDGAVQAWDETSDTFGATIDILNADPVSPRVAAFKGQGPTLELFIPQGTLGYETFDGVTASGTIAAGATKPAAYAFCKWDDRLWALGVDGVLWSSFDGATWGQEAYLDRSEAPRNMFVYLDRSDQPTLFLVSDRAIWAYDPIQGKLVLTSMQDSPHPDFGRGVQIWRPGEDAYISVGMDMYDWNLSSTSSMGPAERDGVPAHLRGHIVDMAGQTTGMFALVQGATQIATDMDLVRTDTVGDDAAYGPASAAFGSVMEWNGFGWRTLWSSQGASGNPSFIKVASQTNVVRLWWGYGGDLYSQVIIRERPTMRQLLEAGIGDFERDGELDTGWQDFGMRSFDKLISHVEINLDAADATTYVEMDELWDQDTGWMTMGRADTVGRTVIPCNVQPNGFSQGCRVNRIRYRIRMHSDDPRKSPLIDSIVVKFLKLPVSSGTWTFRISLDFPDEWNGRTADQIKTDLDALLAKPGFVELQFGETKLSRRVRLTSLTGVDESGWSDLGSRDVAAAEIVIPPSGLSVMDTEPM